MSASGPWLLETRRRANCGETNSLVRRVTKAIRREMRRRAAVEPVIGHLKDDHRMRRNYLKGRDGDRINAVLAAAGFNFSLLLRWLDREAFARIVTDPQSRLPVAAPCIVRPAEHSSRTTTDEKKLSKLFGGMLRVIIPKNWPLGPETFRAMTIVRPWETQLCTSSISIGLLFEALLNALK